MNINVASGQILPLTDNDVEDDVALEKAVHPHPCHAVRNQCKCLVASGPDEDNYLRFADQDTVHESVVELAIVSAHYPDRRMALRPEQLAILESAVWLSSGAGRGTAEPRHNVNQTYEPRTKLPGM